MVDRLELANQYVQEMLEKRDDIVGAFVGGSVARGDATESSDIDLMLIVEGDGEGRQRGGIDTWRDGVYIEAALAPLGQYGDAQKVLHDRFAATQVYDALILYDASGVLSRVQEDVRAVYMGPEYLGIRVRPVLRSLREGVLGLKAAAAAEDLPEICQHAMALFKLPDVPLLIRGITPSSTRKMEQLGSVSPGLQARIREWLGSARLDGDDVHAMLPVIPECLALGGAEFLPGMGDLPRYWAGKAQWMADNGMYHVAFALVWGFVGGLANFARSSDDTQIVSGAERLAQDLLRAAGWEGQEVLQEKVRMAEEMVAEVEAMAAHLPSDEPE